MTLLLEQHKISRDLKKIIDDNKNHYIIKNSDTIAKLLKVYDIDDTCVINNMSDKTKTYYYDSYSLNGHKCYCIFYNNNKLYTVNYYIVSENTNLNAVHGLQVAKLEKIKNNTGYYFIFPELSKAEIAKIKLKL